MLQLADVYNWWLAALIKMLIILLSVMFVWGVNGEGMGEGEGKGVQGKGRLELSLKYTCRFSQDLC